MDELQWLTYYPSELNYCLKDNPTLVMLQISIIFSGTSNNIQPMQLVQTADGQTFIYQPTASAPQPTIDQHQIIHQPAGKCIMT